MTRWLVGMACLSLPWLAVAAGLPDFSASYSVSRNDSPVGSRHISFSRQANRYQFDSVITNSGLAALLGPNPLKEHSEGIIDDAQLLVEQFRRDDGNKPAKNMQLNIDNRQHIVHSLLPVALDYAFQPVLRDPLNEILGFMHQPGGTRLNKYSIADDNGPDHYLLERLGQSTIRTAAGEYPVVQYRRSRVGKQDRFTLIWCAPSLHYLPVRIERHKRDTVITMSLDSVKGL